jgi:exopolysaccharide biosynthesis polyprenyl glycosylphosphotransferase
MSPAAPPRRSGGLSFPLTSFLTDATMLALALGSLVLGGAYAGRYHLAPVWLTVYPTLTLCLLASFGKYRRRLRLEILEDARLTIAATAIAAMVTLPLGALSDVAQVQSAERIWFFSAVYLIAGNAGLLMAQRRARVRGIAATETLVIGAGSVGRQVARILVEHPELGLRPVGYLDNEPVVDDADPLPVLGASWDFDRIVGERGVGHVIFGFSTAPHEVYLRLLARCEELGLEISMVPRLFERLPTRASIVQVRGLQLVSVRPADPRGIQFAFKYLLDRIGAAILLVLLAPLMGLLALAVWISVGRPVLYRQRRVGRGGQLFDMLKFRSMKHAEPGDPEFVVPDSLDSAPGGVEGVDRRTRTGRFLRISSFDELPQLWNVLRGQMSFIGPRPERPGFVSVFKENISRYDERHRVKAGITGWAQVNGLRGKTSLEDRIAADNYYIQNWSLWLDFKIVLLTFAVVLRPRGVE